MASAADPITEALKRGGVIDITTTGRKTGMPRRLEIVFHNIGGRIFISGIPRRKRRSWLANVEADPNLTLHLKRDVHADLRATARTVDDEAERREILPHVARAWNRDDLEEMVRYSPLVEVTFAKTES